MTGPGTRAAREGQRPEAPGQRRPGVPGQRGDERLHRAAMPDRPPAGRAAGGVAPRQVPGPRTSSGPLVARRDPVVRARHSAAPRGSWLRRFVRRHGWRAYAIPLLTVVTLVTLVDVATSATDGRAGSEPAAAAGSSSVAAPPLATAEPSPTAPAQGEGAPAQTPTAPAVTSYVEQGAGTLTVVDGSSPVYGSGPLQRFVVEVEDGIGVDGAQFAAAVESTLGDPRSWGAGGQMSFQRVGAAETAAGDYDFRVSLVSPGNMETYCPGVGTGGYTSCRYGERAVINLARWETAVPDYAGDIATYRLYVVNHEVGHALGNGHQDCPGPGELAPVMQQQTLGLQGCAKNAWPYP
ncbi:hypothetical protein FHX36_004445 [Modestobacter versicolor]|uniref:DUF3152 domain-containing protein n=1 Tax=Modestobacter versicolor TaxID=429133 RepID=A0A839YB21_9ACTN|nr:hypothetical protein [Modestobacter versicolor]